jgi:parallel beta-helix repeat protein
LYPAETEDEQVEEGTSRIMMVSAYTEHDPINIQNDTALAFYAVSGTGDPATPYILEGWNITNGDGDGISIDGTTKHFVVRDCWLSRSVTGDSGILINNVATGSAVIERVHCESWSVGIYVSTSPQTVVKNCSVQDCFVGIAFASSPSGLIRGNILTGNGNNGLHIVDSGNNSIYSNTCNFNEASGIFADTSTELIIANNTCNSNGNGGILIWDGYGILMHGNDCEMNLGSGITLEGFGSCIITSNRLVENELSGLDVWGGRFYEISWNTIMANGGHGTRVSCSDSRVVNNIFALNADYGVRLLYCGNVSVHHNVFVINNGGGIQAYDTDPFLNLWYDPIAAEGNYWSDWDTVGPYYVDGESGSSDIYPLGESDSDSDTLPDSWEIANGLDPYSSDSDSDSLPDEWEVMYGLNPLVDDTSGDLDEDGVSNLREFLLGLNPASEDSDEDLMPDLWELENYLNPLFNDADLDPDEDEISNIDEYLGGTNPHVYNAPSTTTPTTTPTTPAETLGDILPVVLAGAGGFVLAIVLVCLIQRRPVSKTAS